MGFITAVSRYILPFVTIMLLSKCIMTLLLGHPKEKVYGFIIDMKTGEKYALNMWETSIGRSSSNDVVLTYNTISRSHAVISRRIDGWYIYDLDSRSGIKVNGVSCEEKATIKDMDIISLSGIPFRFEVADDPVQRVGKKSKAHAQQSTPGRDSAPAHPNEAPASYRPQAPSYEGYYGQDDQLHYDEGISSYQFRENDFYDEGNRPDLDFNKSTHTNYNIHISDDIYSQQGSFTVETPEEPMKTRQFFQPRLINKDSGEITVPEEDAVNIKTVGDIIKLIEDKQ